MCYLSEGKLEACHNCSNTDFRTLLGIVCNQDPTRPSYPLSARFFQHRLQEASLQSPRQDARIDAQTNLGAQYFRERAQQLTHQAQSSSLRHDTPADGAQRKRQRTDADQPHSVGHDVPIQGIRQPKRQKLDTDQDSSLREDGPIESKSQHGRRGPAPNQASSSRQVTHSHGAAHGLLRGITSLRTSLAREDLKGRSQKPIRTIVGSKK